MNAKLIQKAGLENMIVRGKKYHSPLPFELEDAYCYTKDGGHSIIVVIESEYKEGESVEKFLVPAPVKTIIRHDYKVKEGYVWSNIPYSKEIGLITENGDDEF